MTVKYSAGTKNGYFMLKNYDWEINGGEYIDYYKIVEGSVTINDYCDMKLGRNTHVQRMKWVLDKTDLVPRNPEKSKEFYYMDNYKLQVDEKAPKLKLSKHFLYLEDDSFFNVDDATKCVIHDGPNDKNRYRNANNPKRSRIVVGDEQIQRYMMDGI